MRVQNSTFFPLDNGELFCPIFCASILKCLLQVPCSQRVEVPLILDTTPLWVDISTNCAPPRTWRTKQSECLRLSVRLLIFFLCGQRGQPPTNGDHTVIRQGTFYDLIVQKFSFNKNDLPFSGVYILHGTPPPPFCNVCNHIKKKT